jgi:hypothetical protein
MTVPWAEAISQGCAAAPDPEANTIFVASTKKPQIIVRSAA